MDPYRPIIHHNNLKHGLPTRGNIDTHGHANITSYIQTECHIIGIYHTQISTDWLSVSTHILKMPLTMIDRASILPSFVHANEPF